MLISTKFIYFLPYLYTTSHFKIKGNRFSSSQDICSWKLPNFLHIFLFLRTKLQIYLSRVKITSCCDFFQIWNTNNAHWGLHFLEVWRILRKIEESTYYNITIFCTIFCHTYQMHHQCYGSENFFQNYQAIISVRFWRIFKLEYRISRKYGWKNIWRNQ